ncbi:SDR family oxidoreductase [Pseudidiomarina gelatinasegens]|uniref:UDP-glucose 4-epimerase family protein n=1 Tax=Pseudidiomarina gelatinasegens TaxID=2487740 RepID=UPI0030EDEFD4
MIMNILLTGATGFVGGALLNSLSGHRVTCFGRSVPNSKKAAFVYADFNNYDAAALSFANFDAVVHSAARAHVMNDDAYDTVELYRQINTRGTLNLAEAAAAQGVKRFIFISSIKVNGESTDVNERFSVYSKVNPTDPYGLSKHEAEIGLRKIAAETKMEVVIIRPPLVYGRGVKGNFASMMNLAKRNLPLPLGRINNKRSLVAIDNLVDLIVTCIDHPNAANETFLVSDDLDVSTTELFELMTKGVGKKPRLLPIPKKLLQVAGTFLGKQEIIERLLGNLQVDITHTKQTLNWKPPLTTAEGIKRCFDAKND